MKVQTNLDMFPKLLHKLPINLEVLLPAAIDTNTNTNDYDSTLSHLQVSLNNTVTADGTIFTSMPLFANTTTFDQHNRHQLDQFETCWDDYLTADRDDAQFEFWICGIILNIFGIFGIIGNIISMLVLSRPQMRSSMSYLLIALARCDSGFILASMLLFGLHPIYQYTGYFFSYYNYIHPFISPIVFPIGMIAQTSSIYMTLTVTLERYVAVCHPLKMRTLCTYGRMKIYFIVCVIFSSLYNLPRFWEFRTVSYLPMDATILLHCVRPTLMRRNLTYVNIYIHWCYLIINYIIPFLTLAILNCLIYRQVKRVKRTRQRLSRWEQRAISLAPMLLCVVIVFFMLNSLALVINLTEAFYNIISHSLTIVSNLLITINSSANCLIYVIYGKKFKRIFLQILFKRRVQTDGEFIPWGGADRFSLHSTPRSPTVTLYFSSISRDSVPNSVELSQIDSSGEVKIKCRGTSSPDPIVYFKAADKQRIKSGTTAVLKPKLGADVKNSQITSDV